MTGTLILIHVGFISALVYFVWWQGHKQGRKDMVEQFMNDELVSPPQLIAYYEKKNAEKEQDDIL